MRSARIIAPALIPLMLLVVTGLRGVDFGEHWDEYVHVEGVTNTIENEVLLPGVYPYPSTSYWLMMIAAAPDIVSHALSGEDSKAKLLLEIQSDSFSQRARSIFLLCSALAVPFVYLTVFVWRERLLESLLAATIFGLSWEFAYHARYIAPDCVGLTMGTIALLGCIAAYHQPDRPGWLWVATIGAGLAFGSKWTLGLYLVPLLVTGFFLHREQDSLSIRLGRCTKLGLAFFVVYLISTPGTLLDFTEVKKWILWSRKVYDYGHFGYTVDGGLEHLQRNLEYLLLVFPSRATPLSLAISIMGAFGLVLIVRDSWRTSLILLSCPVLYLLFMSAYNVMHVRNLLLLGPIIAILAARGITATFDALGPRFANLGVAVCCVGLFVINGGWLIYAGESIRASRSQFIGELIDYTEARPDMQFFISPMLCAEFPDIEGGLPSNYTCDPQKTADAYIYLTPEVIRSGGQNFVPSNRRNLNLAMFGPHEVNLDYYSSWPSNRHIRISDRKGAKDMGFPFVRTHVERRKAMIEALQRRLAREAQQAPPVQPEEKKRAEKTR